MAEKRPLGVKASEEFTARVDAYAKSRGVTRTDLVLTAIEHFLELAKSGVPDIRSSAARDAVQFEAGDEVERPVEQADEAPKQHAARPGIRNAAICPECQARVFLDSREAAEAWRCPEHGKGAVQPNNPYFGQSTEPRQAASRRVAAGGGS